MIAKSLQELIWVASETIISMKLATLERVRERAFQGFYMGVRSGKLNVEEALHEWDLLSEVEAAREAIKEPGGLRLAERKAVEEGYRYLVELNNAMATTKRQFTTGRRGDGGTPFSEFRPFYERIRQGRISEDLLKMAPFLRTLDESSLTQSKDLKVFHDRVWGEGPA